MLKGRRRVTSSDIVAHYRVRDDAAADDAATSTAESGRRIGLAVSKAVGNAVTRNTIKRRFRVLANRYEHRLPASCDVVLRAKPGIDRVAFSALDSQVASLFDAIARKAARQ